MDSTSIVHNKIALAGKATDEGKVTTNYDVGVAAVLNTMENSNGAIVFALIVLGFFTYQDNSL